MRNFKHVWKVAAAGVAVGAVFYFVATSHRTTQASAPASVKAAPAALVEMAPITSAEVAEAARGSEALHSANKTDW